MADRSPDLSSVSIDVRPGECLVLSGVRVELVHKSGRVARLRVTAPRDVRIQKTAAEVVPSMRVSVPS